MKMKPWIKLFFVTSAIFSLAACSSMHKKTDDSAVNAANAAYGAQSAGLGEESKFGDQADASTNNLSGRRTAQNGRIYYFDYDSNTIHEADKPAIVANASRLASRPNSKVMLEGHTDPRGSREYNIGLGERRAKSVAELMTAQGVSPSQIRIVSYGAEKPAAEGHAESDYQQDRRAVLAFAEH